MGFGERRYRQDPQLRQPAKAQAYKDSPRRWLLVWTAARLALKLGTMKIGLSGVRLYGFSGQGFPGLRLDSFGTFGVGGFGAYACCAEDSGLPGSLDS